MKKYKVRVKAIEINDSEECKLTFSPCDRTFICNKEYFLGIDDQEVYEWSGTICKPFLFV